MYSGRPCQGAKFDEFHKFSTLLNGLTNGGPVGLIYGFLFVWIGPSLQTLVMGEMASM